MALLAALPGGPGGPAGPTALGVWAATHLVVCAVFSLACVAHGSVGEAELGRKDPGAICADETAGMALTLALCPPQAIGQGLAAWPVVAGAFLAFRLADILKPWPAGALQAAHAGWGILLDDLAAAGYAAAAVWIAWSAGWLPLL